MPDTNYDTISEETTPTTIASEETTPKTIASEETTPTTIASTTLLPEPVKPQHAEKWKGNTDSTSLYFDKLEPSTLYSFRVRYLGKPIIYVMNEKEVKIKLESLDAVVECYTKTKRISGLKQMDVTKDSVSLEWNSHSKLPPNSKFLYYRLSYMNNFTNGSKIQKNITNTSYNLLGLDEGTKYTIKVQVITTVGSSLYSDSISIKTQGEAPKMSDIQAIELAVVSIFY